MLHGGDHYTDPVVSTEGYDEHTKLVVFNSFERLPCEVRTIMMHYTTSCYTDTSIFEMRSICPFKRSREEIQQERKGKKVEERAKCGVSCS